MVPVGCSVVLGSSGSCETIWDQIKIMGGPQRGATGQLIGVDGTDDIVKVDATLETKILDMVILAKLAYAY
ncbi:putative transcription elongation factor spt5 -like 1 [Nicotiana attenuata]|uniref:Transcription elongation factor spt5 -like 1 n=1 Tax=Nicotiana attenuata TaxID=49451 RepID=A0A314L0M1_NICAT|nr:putative transcription elongation factor spt5 -like 1 [Nicotiana attenuata]